MITSHQKFFIPDENHENNLNLEVNWEPKNEKINECKFIRVLFPDGKTAVIKREYFHSILFAISRAEEQRKMIPVIVQEVRNYQTILGITASKDIAKGEKINVRVNIPIPSQRDEIIMDANEQLQEKGITLK